MDGDDLIAAYYACDNEALGTLITRYLARLIGYFRNGGLSPDDAEDTAQQVWVRVMNTKHHLWGGTAAPFDPTAGVPFSAWLFVIARGLLLDARQHRGHTPVQMPAGESGEESAEDEIPAAVEPVETGMVTDELRAAIRDCMEGLPENERLALSLELARGEVEPSPQQRQWAEQNGFTYGAYTAALHRARRLIRDCLDRRQEGTGPG